MTTATCGARSQTPDGTPLICGEAPGHHPETDHRGWYEGSPCLWRDGCNRCNPNEPTTPDAPCELHQQVDAKDAELEALRQQVEGMVRARAEEEVASLRLKHAGPGVTRQGRPSFNMTLEGARHTMCFLADAMVTFFKGEGGTNYVEVKVHHPEGDFILCVQRAAGKTPHELRREAEVERDALGAQVAELKEAHLRAEKRADDAEATADTFGAERDALRQRVAAAEHERDRWKAEYEAERRRRKEHEATMAQLDERVVVLQRESDDWRKKALSRDMEVTRLTSERDESRLRVSDLEMELEGAQTKARIWETAAGLSRNATLDEGAERLVLRKKEMNDKARGWVGQKTHHDYCVAAEEAERCSELLRDLKAQPARAVVYLDEVRPLAELLECPYTLDTASVPAGGVEVNPAQVVGTLSVGLPRLRSAQEAARKLGLVQG